MQPGEHERERLTGSRIRAGGPSVGADLAAQGPGRLLLVGAVLTLCLPEATPVIICDAFYVHESRNGELGVQMSFRRVGDVLAAVLLLSSGVLAAQAATNSATQRRPGRRAEVRG